MSRGPVSRKRAAYAACAALFAVVGCFVFSSSPSEDVGGGLRNLNVSTGTSSSTKRFRHVYFCSCMQNVARSLFPDEFDSDRRHWSSLGQGPNVESLKDGPKGGPTEDDLLLSAWSHADDYCAKFFPEYNGKILNFPGKMLFFMSEAADTHGGARPVDDERQPGRLIEYAQITQGVTASQVPELETPGSAFNYVPPVDRAVLFGPHKDTSNSVQVSMMASMIGFRDPEETRWIWDHSKKPRNTGEYPFVFLASHPVVFRDDAVFRIALTTGAEVHVTDKWLETYKNPAPWLKERAKNLPENLVVQPDNSDRKTYADNAGIFSKYKFSVVMENTYREGYVTEKIYNAFKGGTVPIWYGGKDYALSIFNPEAFVFYDVEDPQPALDRIKHLLENPDAYEAVLQAPILRDGNRTVEEYFSLRDDVGGGKLKNRIRSMMGIDNPAGFGESASVKSE